MISVNSNKKWLLILGAVMVILLAISPVQAVTDAEIKASIDKGVAWIAANQNAAGYWGSSNLVGTTGLCVLKLEEYAWEQGIDPLSADYVYSDQVKKGLAYLFTRVQTGGTHQGSIYYSTQCYETGIAIMAISASLHPELDSGVSDGAGGTLTYLQVVENAADYLVRAQLQTGTYEGGWRYYLGYTSADNSVSGWATLGLTYAKNNFGVAVPATTLTKLDRWIDYIQCSVADWRFGGSGYTSSTSGVDMLKTGNLLFQCAMVGDTVGTQRVKDALTYIQTNWNYNSWDRGWHYTPHGNIDYQTTFCIMKGLEAFGIETLDIGGDPNYDWYGDMAGEIVSKQYAAGNWPNDNYGNTYLTTPWALLTLEKTIEIPATFEVVKSADKTTISAGDSVTYTFEVKNTGFKDISDVVLTDDKLGVIAGPDSGDDVVIGVLEPGEVWIYTATTTIDATTTNIATATGSDGGNPVDAESNPVTVTVGDIPVPEFPTLAIPVFIIGALLFAVVARKE
ncbi:MAG: hypothetical protein APR53_04620 [Methanoculleus sp. SDB]|nr:MAG: hypothetical protein APR53_04620 [Methanoculleus sp. SDB]